MEVSCGTLQLPIVEMKLILRAHLCSLGGHLEPRHHNEDSMTTEPKAPASPVRQGGPQAMLAKMEPPRRRIGRRGVLLYALAPHRTYASCAVEIEGMEIGEYEQPDVGRHAVWICRRARRLFRVLVAHHW